MKPGPPTLAATPGYATYANALAQSQGWGQYGLGLFGGPAQQAVQQSLGGLYAAGRGQLSGQLDATDAINQYLPKAALGQLSGQQAAAQGVQNLNLVGAGQTAGQLYAQQAAENIGAGLGDVQRAVYGVGNRAGMIGAGLTPAQQQASFAQSLLAQQGLGILSGQQYAQGANELLGVQALGQGLGQQYNRGALGLLGQAALGQTPSAAEFLMGRGLQQGLANAQAQAASTRGNFGLASAQKNAMGTGQQLAAQTISQAGALRAQEIAQAQQAYAQGTQAAAALEGQQAQAYGQGAQNYAGLQAAGAGALGAGANAQTQAQLAALGLQGNLYGQGAQAQVQAQIAQAQQAQALAALQAQGYGQAGTLGATLGGQEAQAAQQYGALMSGMSQQQIAALQAYNQAAQTNLGAQLQFAGGQQAAALQAAQLGGNLALGQGNLTIGQAAQAMQQNIANQQMTAQYVGAGATALGAVIAAAVSDERVKTDVRQDPEPENFGAVMAQLDAFRPSTFRYKDARYAPNPEAANERYGGIVAQDAERGPFGRTLVQQSAEGVKHLNLGALAGFLAAGEGALKRAGDRQTARTNDHETRLSALERGLRRAA